MNSDKIQHVTLFVDAKASAGRFAICDSEGEAVWYGRLFEDASGEQSADELSTALKALWLAKQVRESLETNFLHLKLVTDAGWLCTLSGKAAVLTERAKQYGIRLQMKYIQGSKNPADKFTTGAGFLKWSDTHLPALAVLKTEAEIAADDDSEAQAEAQQKAAVQAVPLAKHNPAAASKRQEDGKIADLVGNLVKLCWKDGAGVSKGAFKWNLRDALSKGQELTEDLGHQIFASLSSK